MYKPLLKKVVIKHDATSVKYERYSAVFLTVDDEVILLDLFSADKDALSRFFEASSSKKVHTLTKEALDTLNQLLADGISKTHRIRYDVPWNDEAREFFEKQLYSALAGLLQSQASKALLSQVW